MQLCCTNTQNYDFIIFIFIKIFTNLLKISILQNIYATKPVNVKKETAQTKQTLKHETMQASSNTNKAINAVTHSIKSEANKATKPS
jgi:hypothetical protein